MAARRHVRMISLALSILAAFAVWLVYAYGRLPSSLMGWPIAPWLTSHDSADAGRGGQNSAHDHALLVWPQILPSKLSVTFKCEKEGRVVVGDKPCAQGEKTLRVVAAEYPQPEMQDRLEQMRVSPADLPLAALPRRE